MCSISGFTWEDKSLIRKMNKILAYRGPDDNGIYTNNNISLGHNRLSIIDLSKAGHQPMSDKDGTIWIVFNGEIYNFKEIREKLEKKGHNFNSNTDTEVIIYAYKEFGPNCLSIFNGMFALAIWDERKKELFLARDRIGIKPLYYMCNGKNLIFSSEIKAIIQHDIDKVIDLQSLNSYFTYRFIPSNKTIISRINKLLPGHYAIFSDGFLKIKKYWDLEWKISDKSEYYFINILNKLLFSSVKKRLMSDVPLGAFLSGGIDSSTIVAIMSKIMDVPVKTFTVGYGHETDEFKYAQKVSNFLSTDHHELLLEYKKITRKLPSIIWQMDELHSEITMIPTYFLSEYAKKKVTVVNLGEGADELFSGYITYKIGANMFKPVPKFLKKLVYIWNYSPFKKRDRNKLFKFSFTNENILNKYLTCKNPPHYPKNFLNRLLFFDIKNELPNWELTRADRMTTAHGIEGRVPFLDYKIVELSTRIQARYKQPNFNGKFILKKLALNYLPRDIVLRKKQGFTTPMHAWIKENLEDAFEVIFFNNKKPFFDYNYIKQLIQKHKALTKPKPFKHYSFQLFILLFFDIWYEMYINDKPIKEIEKMLAI